MINKNANEVKLVKSNGQFEYEGAEEAYPLH